MDTIESLFNHKVLEQIKANWILLKGIPQALFQHPALMKAVQRHPWETQHGKDKDTSLVEIVVIAYALIPTKEL